jgi:hypothetical protein
MNYKDILFKQEKIDNRLSDIKIYIKTVNTFLDQFNRDAQPSLENGIKYFYNQPEICDILTGQKETTLILNWLKEELGENDERLKTLRKEVEEVNNLWQQFEEKNKENIIERAFNELKIYIKEWSHHISCNIKYGFESFLDDYPNDCDIRDSIQALMEYLEEKGVNIDREKKELAKADELLKAHAKEAAKVPGFSLEKKDLPPYIPESHWWWYIGNLAKEKEDV